MRQLKLRGSAGPSSRRPDAIHATWTRARPAWPAPVRWLGQRARWWAAGGSICVATLIKRGLLPLPTHQPPLTPLRRLTLPTEQGLAQAEKPKPACSLAPHSSRASTGEERRIDLHPVLLRAGVLPRPDKLRASRERPAKLHEAPSSRQLRHVEPAGLASSSCCGTRSESVAERGYDHA